MISVLTIGSLYWSSQSQPPTNRETGYSNVLIQDWPISWRNANIDRLLLWRPAAANYFSAKFSAENAEPKVCAVFGDSAANFLNLNTHTNILIFKANDKTITFSQNNASHNRSAGSTHFFFFDMLWYFGILAIYRYQIIWNLFSCPNNKDTIFIILHFLKSCILGDISKNGTVVGLQWYCDRIFSTLAGGYLVRSPMQHRATNMQQTNKRNNSI